MEIRRKVFSLLEDENGEERYYSTTEFEIDLDEETGEKLFSEKEKEEKKGMSKGGKIALGTAGSLAVGIGALELANILKKKHISAADRKALKKTISSWEKYGMKPEQIKAMTKNKKADLRAANKGIGFVEKGNAAVKGAYNTAKVNTKIAVDKVKGKVGPKIDAAKTRREQKKTYKKLFKELDDAAKKA